MQKAVFYPLKMARKNKSKEIGAFKVIQNIDFEAPAITNWTPSGSIFGQTEMNPAKTPGTATTL